MENSTFIVQLLALVYIVVGLGMLVSPDYYRKGFEKMIKNTGVMYLGGLLALVIGFTIITYHNVWIGWESLVTIIGWIAFMKGLSLLLFPKAMTEFSMKFLKKNNFSAYGTVALILGLVFAYFGFIAT